MAVMLPEMRTINPVWFTSPVCGVCGNKVGMTTAVCADCVQRGSWSLLW